MLTGVVLAAGEAKRLPNKALLPLKDKHIAIENAISFCFKACCHRVVVVVNTSGVIETVLKQRNWVNGIDFAVQPGAFGVPDAIQRASAFVQDYALVTFCDNIYPDEDLKLITAQCSNAVSTRRSANPQLDFWCPNEREWKKRPAPDTRECIAGWYFLKREACVYGTPGMDPCLYLNKIGAKAVHCDPHSWTDIGTVDSYLKFLRS